MWPKNATVYSINPHSKFPLEQLQAARFSDIGSHNSQSVGFVPVRGDELTHKQGKHILLKFMVEKKILPPSAVASVVEARVAELVEQQGFPPGKKQRKELKERAVDELLPRALTSRRATLVWIDQKSHRIVIDSTSAGTCDEILKQLIKVFADSLGSADPAWPRAKVITEWVADEPPANFTIDDAAALKYPGEKAKAIKYDRADLDAIDVQRHIESGAFVQAVAMTYGSRVSFVMTDNGAIRKIKPLDILKEGQDAVKDVDRFEADVELMTLEMGALLDAIADAA